MNDRAPSAPHPVSRDATTAAPRGLARAQADSAERVVWAGARLARSAGRLATASQAIAASEAVWSAGVRAQVRASVAAFTRGLRAQGAPPARIVVEVKSALRSTLGAALPPADHRLLTAVTVRWGFEAYDGTADEVVDRAAGAGAPK